MRLSLRYPATAANASEHAALAVKLGRAEFDLELDYSPGSLEDVDTQIENLRNDGHTGEDAAEILFVLGCYLGEVMVRRLGGRWIPTTKSRLKDVSPWPMVVLLPPASTWDPIGKAFKRLELGDAEYLPAYFNAAAETAGGQRA